MTLIERAQNWRQRVLFSKDDPDVLVHEAAKIDKAIDKALAAGTITEDDAIFAYNLLNI